MGSGPYLDLAKGGLQKDQVTKGSAQAGRSWGGGGGSGGMPPRKIWKNKALNGVFWCNTTGEKSLLLHFWNTSPIDLPSPVTQISLSTASPDLLYILSGDTGGSHLQRDEPVSMVRRPWKGGL